MLSKEGPLLENVEPDSGAPATRVYARRWWVLGVYSCFALLQGFLWGIPGPISDSYMQVYGMDGVLVQVSGDSLRARA